MGAPSASSTSSQAFSFRFAAIFSLTSLEMGISPTVCATISSADPIPATASASDRPSSIRSSISSA